MKTISRVNFTKLLVAQNCHCCLILVNKYRRRRKTVFEVNSLLANIVFTYLGVIKTKRSDKVLLKDQNSDCR